MAGELDGMADLRKKKVGPPFSYHDGIPEQVYNMGLLGLSNEQIANALGIELCTIYEWANTYPKLADALYESREIADGKVVRSLYERAVGAKVLEVKTFFDEKTGTVVKENVIKEFPPEVGAAMSWLKNRQPKLWRERQYDPLTEEGINVSINVVQGRDPASTKDQS